MCSRVTVWRHQRDEVERIRTCRTLTCSECTPSHTVPAADFDDHRRMVLEREYQQTAINRPGVLRGDHDFSSVVDGDEEEEGEEEDPESMEFVESLRNFVYEDLDDDFEVDLSNTEGMHNPCIYCKYANIVGQYDDKVDFFIQLNKWFQQSGVARAQYTSLRNLLRFCLHIDLPSLRRRESHLRSITTICPQFIDCCPSGCMAYTGSHAKLAACTHCNTPRYQEHIHIGQKLKARQHFLYIPIVPRLKIQYSNGKRSHVLKTYRKALMDSYKHGQLRDFWDGDLFRTYHHAKLGLFKQPTDVGLQLSLDGVQLVRKKTHSVTPVILLNQNLPPSERVWIQNILLSTLIPGPREPIDLDSFLYPLVQEMKTLDRGVAGVEDGAVSLDHAGRIFTLHAWITTVTGTLFL
jgi:hypothetical protein